VTVSTLERVAAGVRAAADDAMTDVNAVQSTPFTYTAEGETLKSWQYEIRESGQVLTVTVDVWGPRA
jgi:hypothetical protein